MCAPAAVGEARHGLRKLRALRPVCCNAGAARDVGAVNEPLVTSPAAIGSGTLTPISTPTPSQCPAGARGPCDVSDLQAIRETVTPSLVSRCLQRLLQKEKTRNAGIS